MTLDDLRSTVSGPVLEPGDAGFEEEVAAHNLIIRNRPDVAVGVADEADVVAAVRYAAEHRIPVHVQATGHGAHDPVEGGMLVLTKRLDAVSIDPRTGLATIGAGARWAAVIAAAAAFSTRTDHPARPPTSEPSATSSAAVSAPLIRSHGVSSDYVRGLRLVTPRGEAISVRRRRAPDLFWALRGGKGGFGVVTGGDGRDGADRRSSTRGTSRSRVRPSSRPCGPVVGRSPRPPTRR